jgi:UPF0271 protein
VTGVDGRPVAVVADTICLHGDTPGAAELAAAIRARLAREGILVRGLTPFRSPGGAP